MEIIIVLLHFLLIKVDFSILTLHHPVQSTNPNPCLVLSCLVLSCLVLSCLVLSCLFLSCLVLSCLVLSCTVLSHLVLTLLHLSILSCTSFSFSPFFYSRNDREDRLEVFLFFWLARLKILISSLQVIFFKFCFSILFFHIFNQ